MKNFYRNILMVSFLVGILPPVYAMSKLYQTYASVVLVNNRPCVYVTDLIPYYQGRPVQGIEVYKENNINGWYDETIKVYNSKDKCVIPDYVFETGKEYDVWVGGNYAYIYFCLMRDNINGLFLTEVGKGDKCTTRPFRNEDYKVEKSWLEWIFS